MANNSNVSLLFSDSLCHAMRVSSHQVRDFAIFLVYGVTFAVVATLSHVELWVYGFARKALLPLLGFKLSEFVYFVLFYFILFLL